VKLIRKPVCVLVIAVAALAVAVAGGTTRNAAAALPPGNSVEQWNQIAVNTVVGSGAFQNEGLTYMAYESAAVYDAVVAIRGGYRPYGHPITAATGASADAAVVEAAYRTLLNYFPSQASALGAQYAEALALVPDGSAKSDGQAVGLGAANQIITLRSSDGRMTPIGTTSSFPTVAPGPGVWRLTPPAFASPQTPWVANIHPFVLGTAGRFLPGPPPSLQSDRWVEAFKEIKDYGAANSGIRTTEQTNVAKFWSANVIRQYNGVARDIADSHALGLLRTARLAAMVNVVGADAQISVMFAKYHYLFWRPVSAIDSSAVTNDGFGPVPGYDDGNSATIEQAGWRPLLATPNHPEYPAAHGSMTSAMAEVFSAFLGTNRFSLDIHGFDPTGPAGNLNAVQHFQMPSDLRGQIVNARVWAGVHYRFSGVAGVVLGRNVAKYDLRHAFQPVG
jgi:vanadium-dependent haloperoxidase-like protein